MRCQSFFPVSYLAVWLGIQFELGTKKKVLGWYVSETPMMQHQVEALQFMEKSNVLQKESSWLIMGEKKPKCLKSTYVQIALFKEWVVMMAVLFISPYTCLDSGAPQCFLPLLRGVLPLCINACSQQMHMYRVLDSIDVCGWVMLYWYGFCLHRLNSCAEANNSPVSPPIPSLFDPSN